MKTSRILLSFTFSILACFVNGQSDTKWKSGDIIFQTSTSPQSLAIRKATNSKYSHCGLVMEINGSYFVYEAIQPVSLTPIKKWIDRGQNKHYSLKRLKADTLLTTQKLKEIKLAADKYLGLNYDLLFEWDDTKMYCSELVWKVYNKTLGVKPGQLQKLKEFNLEDPLVKQKLKERYGSQVPYESNVISPAAIYNSPLLKLVH